MDCDVIKYKASVRELTAVNNEDVDCGKINILPQFIKITQAAIFITWTIVFFYKTTPNRTMAMINKLVIGIN